MTLHSNTDTFTGLGLLEPILAAVSDQGYHTPTPIQSQAIPHLLAGRDLLGIAQTGTGKTAAFALPILDFLAGDPKPARPRRPSALVLTPTRELAAQIAESFRVYGRNVRVKHAVVFGGVRQASQVRALRSGIDVLVATPGRLIDLLQQGHLDLSAIEIFVLDEADRMLDMGFLRSVKSVIARLPRRRQSMLFSATMPDDIVELARSILRDPLRVEVSPPATTVDQVTQSVILVEKSDKRGLLAEVLRDGSIGRALVFTRTKHGADRVVKHLRRLGEEADAIHGDKSQPARERALAAFRSGRVRVLVATDIAARGIDVRDITHVINFDIPCVPESYVHRIGRTARAGREGVAISFCSSDERDSLRAIERAIRRKLRIVGGDAGRAAASPNRATSPGRSGRRRDRRPSSGRPSGPGRRPVPRRRRQAVAGRS